MNKVYLTGRWAREISLSYTPQGTAIAKCAIAVEDGYGDNKTTHFFEVEAWKQTAEAIANYSDKGLRVLIEGRLKVDRWETQDGQKRSMVKVTADRVEIIDFKERAQPLEQTDPFAAEGRPIGISDEDLPF